jgi:hypothetical protein
MWCSSVDHMEVARIKDSPASSPPSPAIPPPLRRTCFARFLTRRSAPCAMPSLAMSAPSCYNKGMEAARRTVQDLCEQAEIGCGTERLQD